MPQVDDARLARIKYSAQATIALRLRLRQHGFARRWICTLATRLTRVVTWDAAAALEAPARVIQVLAPQRVDDIMEREAMRSELALTHIDLDLALPASDDLHRGDLLDALDSGLEHVLGEAANFGERQILR